MITQLLKEWYNREPKKCFPFRDNWAIIQPGTRHVIYDGSSLSDKVWLQRSLQHAIALKEWSLALRYCPRDEVWHASIYFYGYVLPTVTTTHVEPSVAMLSAYVEALAVESPVEAEVLA